MAQFGKDIFGFDRSRTNVEVEFGADCYWVEREPEGIPYGTVLWEILDLNLREFQGPLYILEEVVQKKDYQAAPRAFMDLAKSFGSFPLYRFYLEDFRFFGSLEVEQFVIGEARDAFAEAVIDGTLGLSELVEKTLDEIIFIKNRYGWFLDTMFEGAVFEKKKGQRKKPLAEQVVNQNLDAYVSGISLGAAWERDAPPVNVQYVVRSEKGREPEVVEKMYFNRLIDFVYVEFMKGLQKGFAPKRCANCGKWFLQTPGATYAYCERTAPGETEKTCRDIGAAVNFQSKVKNNPIWQIHQRAYKKYFARTTKGAMTKAEFEVWAREAEQLRDQALREYEKAAEGEREKIEARVREDLNAR